MLTSADLCLQHADSTADGRFVARVPTVGYGDRPRLVGVLVTLAETYEELGDARHEGWYIFRHEIVSQCGRGG